MWVEESRAGFLSCDSSGLVRWRWGYLMMQVGWSGVDQTVEMMNENVLRCSVIGLYLPVPFWLTDGRFPVGCEPCVASDWSVGRSCAFLIRSGWTMRFPGCELFLYFSGKVGLFGHPVLWLVPPGWSCPWRLTRDQLNLPPSPLQIYISAKTSHLWGIFHHILRSASRKTFPLLHSIAREWW